MTVNWFINCFVLLRKNPHCYQGGILSKKNNKVFNFDVQRSDPTKIIYDKNENANIWNPTSSFCNKNRYTENINQRFPEYTSNNLKGLSYIRNANSSNSNSKIEEFRRRLNKML